jgi:hypothetical protein
MFVYINHCSQILRTSFFLKHKKDTEFIKTVEKDSNNDRLVQN